MNEQIKRLAEKAGSTHKQNLGVYQFYTGELEKFAELIVQECREVIGNDIDANSDDDFDLGLDHARQIIGEHFGVEE